MAIGIGAVIDGFRYLGGQPVLLMSFLVDIIAMVFGMPRALFPEMAHVAFGGPEGGGLAFALLFAGIPAGAVIGGIFSGWVSRITAQGQAVVWCVVVWGLAMVGFGVAVAIADSSPEAAVWMLGAAVVMLIVGGAADMASAALSIDSLASSVVSTCGSSCSGICGVTSSRISSHSSISRRRFASPSWRRTACALRRRTIGRSTTSSRVSGTRRRSSARDAC